MHITAKAQLWARLATFGLYTYPLMGGGVSMASLINPLDTAWEHNENISCRVTLQPPAAIFL